MYDNPWTFNGKEIDSADIDKYVGFVYLITNIKNGKKYVGKKLFNFAKTRQVKKKIKRYKAESDWKEYYGSSNELQEDITKFGKECFKREILHMCLTKGTMSYIEAKEQFSRAVLESDEYYNGQIRVRVHQSQLKLGDSK